MLGLLSVLAGAGCLLHSTQPKESLPNILWIVCEDTSPHLGCYGDKFATTPNIDKFARGGVLFENVFSAPACSPSRSTLITGVCASTLGTENLRSKYPIPDFIKFFPSYLRKAGYYTTNNGKEDYNTFLQKEVWDESSPVATYMNRKTGQPFFAVFNIGITHESRIHRSVKNLKHNPEQVPLPPYHPATPEMKHDWALFYDNIGNMDEQVGKMLEELEENGLSENTIVFFFSDNGGVIARSKRFINESGLRVPLIIRFPDKYMSLAPGKPGSRNARIISFEDFAPTLLSLADVEIPNYMEGKAFLGKQQAAEKEYAFAFRSRIDERIDIIRSIRNQRFRYVRNYMPHKIYGQHTEYMWQAASVVSWEKAFRSGSLNAVQETFWKQKPAEELYDVTVDPFNVKNLASEKEYANILSKMRTDNRNVILQSKDAGFIPEAIKVSISETSTIFEFARSDQYPLVRILETAEMASSLNADFTDKIIERLRDENPIVRYWAALGCCILKPVSKEAKSALIKLLKDDETVVRIMASEALWHLGEKTLILPVLTEALESDNMYARLEAVTALEVMGQDAGSSMPALSQMISKREDIKLKNAPTWKLEHDIKIAKQLVKKLSD